MLKQDIHPCQENVWAINALYKHYWFKQQIGLYVHAVLADIPIRVTTSLLLNLYK